MKGPRTRSSCIHTHVYSTKGILADTRTTMSQRTVKKKRGTDTHATRVSPTMASEATTLQRENFSRMNDADTVAKRKRPRRWAPSRMGWGTSRNAGRERGRDVAGRGTGWFWPFYWLPRSGTGKRGGEANADVRLKMSHGWRLASHEARSCSDQLNPRSDPCRGIRTVCLYSVCAVTHSSAQCCHPTMRRRPLRQLLARFKETTDKASPTPCRSLQDP